MTAPLQKFSTQDEEDTISRVDRLLRWAAERGTSDIHLEPRRERGEIYLRLDGVLFPAGRLPLELWEPTISRLKILAGLPVYLREQAQDGRLNLLWNGEAVQARLALLPTLHGEKAVVRFFDLPGQRIRWPQLGLSDEQQEQLLAVARQKQGLILFTGPSGSGKTTTIYALLEEIASAAPDSATPRVNIATLEDPIERELPFASQTEIHPALGMTFARCLSTLLRQDPEVIAIGEIRDPETARIATRAALTGHLVISTVHSADTAEVFLRLLDMGVEPYLVASCVSAVFGQRLVRTLCPACRSAPPSGEESPCPTCGGTGYRGRTLVGELLVPDEAFREHILNKTPIRLLRQAAQELIEPTLEEHARRKCASGLTSPDELERLKKLQPERRDEEKESQ